MNNKTKKDTSKKKKEILEDLKQIKKKKNKDTILKKYNLPSQKEYLISLLKLNDHLKK